MDHLRQAERFRVAQEEALARVRANPANPPMTSPLPHSNSSSHPSNPNAFPLQPPSLSPSPHSNSSSHPSNPNAIPLQPPSPLLFTTNPAVSMSDEAATAILDQLCNTTLPQDSSRLFA